MLTLRVMTYNIQGHAANGRPDHIPKIAEVIAAAAPDVVGLQEVHFGTRAFAGHQAEQIAALSKMNVAFGKSTRMEGGEYGNAVLTRHELARAHVYPLPGSGEPRSVLQTDIAARGQTFTFFATHLAAWGRLLRVARIRQVQELGDIIARGEHPHILCGDFNVPPGSEEMNTLIARGHLRLCGEATEATFPMTRQRLDYIMCGPQWEVASTEVIRRGPSDHWPFVVELKLTAG